MFVWWHNIVCGIICVWFWVCVILCLCVCMWLCICNCVWLSVVLSVCDIEFSFVWWWYVMFCDCICLILGVSVIMSVCACMIFFECHVCVYNYVCRSVITRACVWLCVWVKWLTSSCPPFFVSSSFPLVWMRFKGTQAAVVRLCVSLWGMMSLVGFPISMSKAGIFIVEQDNCVLLVHFLRKKSISKFPEKLNPTIWRCETIKDYGNKFNSV